MPYIHKQTGALHYVLYLSAVAFLIGAWLLQEEPPAIYIFSGTAALVAVCGLGFHHLTVRDDGDHLTLRYGPLPLFSKRISYADITAVEASRSSIIDGWGIHYAPGRGWTYNLWGRDCAKITLGRRVIRVGTDDVKNLVAFLQKKIRQTV
ncbi:MAG: hypothetical protein HQ581_29355 [Planctomycetes bacterium]|nr:hypothetical protein [Planctomycetota bacterium]